MGFLQKVVINFIKKQTHHPSSLGELECSNQVLLMETIFLYHATFLNLFLIFFNKNPHKL